MIEEWTKVKNELIGKDAEMELVSSDNISVCRFEFTKPTHLKVHQHENEQITYVLEGEIIIEFGGRRKLCKPGDVCIIPGNIPHSAEINKIPFRSLDIFSPVRTDFINRITD